MTPKVGSLVNVYERKEGQLSVFAEMINSWCLPARKCVRAQQDRNSFDWAVYVGTRLSCLKYNLQCIRTLNMSPCQTKPTILQCMYDQQRLRLVCASTHYIKQASWIALSPQEVHTVWSSKGLIRMCYCSCTVDPALDSPAIEGKYDQRMLWSECAVAQTHPSIRLSYKRFCYIQRLHEVHLISEGSDQTTDVQVQCAGWPDSPYKFYCWFCHTYTHARIVCAILNAALLSKIFNRLFEIFFSFFNLTFHANCLHCMKCQILFSIAWNVKSAVFWEIKK